MSDVNYLAVAVAVVVAFVASSVWYIVFGRQLAELSSAAAGGRPPAWKVVVELLRSLLVATVVAGLAAQLELDRPGGALLGLALWVGFPFVLLTGSVIWENVPWKLAAIHAGDWLVKLVLVAVIVSGW